MNWEERITVDPTILAGKPVIVGTRLAVEFIVELLANGWTEQQIIDNYPGLTHDDIAAAIRFDQSQGNRLSMPLDTTPDAQQVQLRLLREKSPSERLALALRLTSEVIRASKRAISRACPELTEREVGYRFVELHYGRELAEGMKRSEEARGNGRTE